MKEIASTSDFAIYDDVLPDDEKKEVWKYAQQENYTTPSKWIKVWRATDRQPIGSKDYYWGEDEMPKGMSIAGHYIYNIAKHCEDIVGKEGEQWNRLCLRAYVYPAGSKLSWHNDGGYAGAIIFYSHPQWGAHWGGELMIAQVPPEKKSIIGSELETQWRDELILSYGIGHYISAKPNRLVVTAPGVWHNMNRVDSDAGENLRCSIVGFLSHRT